MWATLLHLTPQPEQSRADQNQVSKAPLPHPKLMVWFHQTKNVSIPSAADSLARETLNRIFHNFYYFLSVGSYRLPVSQSPLYPGPVLLYKLLFFAFPSRFFFNFPNIFAFEGLEKCQHTPFFCVYSRLFACWKFLHTVFFSQLVLCFLFWDMVIPSPWYLNSNSVAVQFDWSERICWHLKVFYNTGYGFS